MWEESRGNPLSEGLGELRAYMLMTGWHSCVVVSSVASEQQVPGFKSTNTLGSVESPCSLYASAGSPTVYTHAYCW